MQISLCNWSLDLKEELQYICNYVDRTYLSDRMPSPYTEEDALWWLHMVKDKEGTEGIFRAIVVDGKVIGSITIEKCADISRKDCELGYMILKDYYGKGITSKACEMICQIAFKELDIVRISANVFEPNEASKKILEKNGFLLEGIKKNAFIKNNTFYDAYIYGKVKE